MQIPNINLIGLRYPVTDATTNEICGYKIIQRQHELENSAAICISLKKEGDSWMSIGYPEVFQMIKEQTDLSENV